MKIVILYVCSLLGLLTVSSSSVSCSRKFVIIVDGGSSGTRLHVFEFEKSDRTVKLIKGFRFKSKIALSKFSNSRADWNLMRMMITNLTSDALRVIPDQCISNTPFYFQVTAGVRQIEHNMSKKILDHVRDILLKTNFYFKPEFIGILSTLKEGSLAWISINFLLNRLQPSNTSNIHTVGMLDLGGGSTQVSFATTNPDLLSKSILVKIFGYQYHVFTSGYDYMGINEIRIRYFNAENCLQETCQQTTVRSPCLHPEVKGPYQFGNRTIEIGGRAINKYRRICECYSQGMKMIQSIKPIRKYFDKMEFVAIAAYYYILKAAKNILTETKDELYQTSIVNIIFRAFEICQNPDTYIKKDRYDHFLCLDMSYLIALLHNGYGFEWYDKLLLGLKINNTSLSWALGYAISIL